MTIPTTPGPIHLEVKDGTTEVVECVYEGLEDDVHIWKVPNALPGRKELTVGFSREVIKNLPAHTSVVIRRSADPR